MKNWKSIVLAPVAFGLVFSTISAMAPTTAIAATKKIKASTVAQIVNAGLDDAKIHLNNFGK